MRLRVLALLVLACLVGLLVRITNLESVFPQDGPIILGFDDSFFHARRALYTFENFPAVLEFDRYLAYPRGAAQPSPPFHDWLIAGTARLFGDDIRTFECAAAWISPVLGAIFALSAFWIARSVAGARVGLIASWLVAVIPAGALLTSLGNCDHHGAVGLLGSFWIAASLRELQPSGRQLALHGLLHAAIVTALMLAWSGSLLYVTIGEGSRLATILLCRARPERYLTVAGSELLAAAVVSLWLISSAAPLGGSVTSQTLSWLHPIVLVALGVLSATLGALERFRPVENAQIRLGRAALIGLCVALPLLEIPEIRDALAAGLAFVGKQDAWARTNPEQMPLFQVDPTVGVQGPTTRFGYFVYTVPLLPLLVAYRGFRAKDECRDRWLLLLLWMVPLCVLTLSQIRYATDFSVLAAVGFALFLNEVRIQLTRRIAARPAVAITTGFALIMLIPVYSYHAPRIARVIRVSMHRGDSHPFRRMSETRTLYEFARMTRDATPETSGFLDETQIPEYGVLVPPVDGHLFTYVARRPLPANNLGPYLDPELFEHASAFYSARRTEEALGHLEALQVRYFITAAGLLRRNTFVGAVHRLDDSWEPGQNRPSTGRIRLVVAGPRNGSPVRFFGPPGERKPSPPYKLFEFVEGAVLVAEAAPNTLAIAELRLVTPLGPTRHRASQRADESGQLRLRVAYPSAAPNTPEPRVHAVGPWRLKIGDRRYEVAVTEDDVREGREVPLGDPLPPRQPRSRSGSPTEK